jgi:hypothetical protein
MPSTVTAFSVQIASLGETATESVIVRDVIGQWNARNALEQKRILLPLDGENHCPPPGDLLVAFFCGTAGTPLDHGIGGSELEIEKHLACERPALIYFSDARAHLFGTPELPGRALEEFKRRFAGAVVDSYADEKEFRAKFARQLDGTIVSHDHFDVSSSRSSKGVAAAGAALAAAPITKPLSSCAQTILSEACDDFEAYIGRIKVGGCLRIQANGKQLVDSNNPSSVAQWDNAFEELLSGQYIRDAGCNGQLFQISPKGFDFLKTIGKTPVGYIAELGGM